MKYLGKIVRLQVQLSSLKVGQRGRVAYDPEALVSVPAITLGADGIAGWTDSGQRMIDIHNRLHPESKNRGDNGMSVLFTPHYAAMRARFGDHLRNGIAGESILVETGTVITEDTLCRGLVIVSADGNEALLHDLIAAEPCVEFTRFALRYPPDSRSDNTVAEALRYLRDGMRGFYARYSGKEARVHVGDEVLVMI